MWSRLSHEQIWLFYGIKHCHLYATIPEVFIRVPPQDAIDGAGVFGIPAPLVWRMASPSREAEISFGSSEGVYIRIDRGHIAIKCLTRSGEYPYTRGLPWLDRTDDLKIDARLAAVLLHSRDEQKRYTGEE